MDRHVIVGIHITDRVGHAVPVQHVLTEFGAAIKTRIGLHEVGPGAPTPGNGLILIEVVGDDATLAQLTDRLDAIEGVDVQKMIFEHA